MSPTSDLNKKNHQAPLKAELFGGEPEQFWKTVIDTMMDGLLIVDPEGFDPGRQSRHGGAQRLPPGGTRRPALHHPEM